MFIMISYLFMCFEIVHNLKIYFSKRRAPFGEWTQENCDPLCTVSLVLHLAWPHLQAEHLSEGQTDWLMSWPRALPILAAYFLQLPGQWVSSSPAEVQAAAVLAREMEQQPGVCHRPTAVLRTSSDIVGFVISEDSPSSFFPGPGLVLKLLADASCYSLPNQGNREEHRSVSRFLAFSTRPALPFPGFPVSAGPL